MSIITIQKIETTDELYTQVYNLREEVLRKPLGLSLKNENLSGDNEDVIFIAIKDTSVVGCLMVKKINKKEAKLRQMAISEIVQQQGIGSLLMKVAEKFIWESGYTTIGLHARKSAAIFYLKLGYNSIGNEFEEVGIPHLLMVKSK
jgi:predicted GNAT family N-acyltransferase